MADTRTAALKKKEAVSEEKGQVLTFESENGPCLTEYLMISESGAPVAYCSLSWKDGQEHERKVRGIFPFLCVVWNGLQKGSGELW